MNSRFMTVKAFQGDFHQPAYPRHTGHAYSINVFVAPQLLICHPTCPITDISAMTIRGRRLAERGHSMDGHIGPTSKVRTNANHL